MRRYFSRQKEFCRKHRFLPCPPAAHILSRMSHRLRVLLSAFACEPEKGSEPEVGWQWALQMARYHDVTVLTQSKNEPAIKRVLKSLHGSQPEPRFVYFDMPKWMQKLRKYPIGLRIYYVFWQKSARAFVRQLHEEEHFDLLHHVTFAAFRYPTVIWDQGALCIWGPIGGIESIPVPLLPWSHPVSLVEEGFRNISNLLAATPFRDLPKRAAASNKVIVTTREMQETLAKLEVQSQLMPTIGLKTSDFPYQPHRSSNGPLKILFVGKIITLKGIDLALKALSESDTAATLTFIGTGNYLPAARRLVKKLGLDKRVVFRGQVTRQEVLALYPEFDVLLFPSLHDTGGYAVIEAMFNELPVICLDCGGPAVAVEAGCGIKVSVKSRDGVIAGLAEGIRYYDKDRQALLAHGKAAREAILKNYDWDQKGAQMNEVYQQVMAQTTAGRQKRTQSGPGGTSAWQKTISMKGALLTLIALLMIGGWGYFSIGELKHQAWQIVYDTLPGLSFAGEANGYIVESSRTLLFVTTDDPAQRENLRQEIDEQGRRTAGYLQAYDKQIFSAEDRTNFEDVEALRGEYIQVRDKILNLAEAGKKHEALTMYSSTLLPIHAKVKAAADKLFQFNMLEGQQRGRRIMTICTITQIVLAVTSVGIFVLGFFIGFFK